MTGRCPTAGQHLVEAVASAQSIDRHFDTDIDVRVTSQPFFLGGRLAQTHLQAERQETSRECTGESTSANRELGKMKLSSCEEAHRAPEQFLFKR